MRKYTGWIILATLILYLVSTQVPAVLPVPALLAWLVCLLSWHGLTRNAARQALVLLLSGIAALLFAGSQGVSLGGKEIFAANLPLLAMFVAVAFLTLTNRDLDDPDLPHGNKAVVITALGTHFLGAVINLSVLFVFGDRLQKNGTLSREQMIILARSFSAAAWWSPFFIATGVALTYAPGMYWRETLIPGACMSAIAISYSVVEVCWIRKKEFSGYPLKLESLTVPLCLAAAVILTHHLQPEVKVLHLICIVSPLGAILFMKGRPRLATLHDFVTNRISSVSSQFILFLAAGVFSSGIKSIILVYPNVFKLAGLTFTPLLFAALLAMMIIVGIMGVHPIVSIAIVSPLLLPLHPDPSQLGYLFLSSWAISTGSSPLSGVGLALLSRYHASPRIILHSNWHYALIMWAVASLMNMAFWDLQ